MWDDDSCFTCSRVRKTVCVGEIQPRIYPGNVRSKWSLYVCSSFCIVYLINREALCISNSYKMYELLVLAVTISCAEQDTSIALHLFIVQEVKFSRSSHYFTLVYNNIFSFCVSFHFHSFYIVDFLPCYYVGNIIYIPYSGNLL